MSENVRGLTSAAVVGGGISAVSAGYEPTRDEYGYCGGGMNELFLGRRVEVLAEKMANPETKDSREVAQLKSDALETLEFFVQHEITSFEDGYFGLRGSGPAVQAYLTQFQACALDAEFRSRLMKDIEALKTILSVRHGPPIEKINFNDMTPPLVWEQQPLDAKSKERLHNE